MCANTTVFWDVMPRRLVTNYHPSELSSRFHLQDEAVFSSRLLVHECEKHCDFETAVDTAQHPRKPEMSATPLSEPQISHVQYCCSRLSYDTTLNRKTTSSRNSSKSWEQLSNSDLYVSRHSVSCSQNVRPLRPMDKKKYHSPRCWESENVFVGAIS